MPKPPEHLSDEEKEKWKSTVRELHPLGLITTIDMDGIIARRGWLKYRTVNNPTYG